MKKTPIDPYSPYSAPDFPLPKGQKSAGVYLRALCLAGLTKRMKSIPLEYLTQLNRELCCFAYKGWGNFLLIVQDLVTHLSKRGVSIGPGGGVAPGSLVLFALEITDLDPLKHGLLFERYLSLKGKAPPDLDLALSPGGSKIALDYLRDKYGTACVLAVEIYGKAGWRHALAKAGFTLDRDGDVVNKANFKKLQSGECRKLNVDALYNLSLRRNTSPEEWDSNSAAVALVKDMRQILVPLEIIEMGRYPALISLSQSGMIRHGITHINIFDWNLLGRLARAEKILRRSNRAFSLATIPEDDPKTFAMLSGGEAAGLRQFSLPLMRKCFKHLNPQNLSHLVALEALNRPGPIAIGLLDLFMKARHGKVKPTFHLTQIEGILSETYGVLVYHEQVMQIAKVLAGFSPEDANPFRREFGKRNPDSLKVWRGKFTAGCKINGIKAAAAVRVFNYLNKYATYGICKAHIMCHTLGAYRLAYIKANYAELDV